METAVYVVALAFVAGGLMAGFGVFLYMRVVVGDKALDNVIACSEANAAIMRAESAALTDQIMRELTDVLTAKNTTPPRPAQPETRRIRARTMSQAAQMAEDDAAREDGR